MYDSGTDDASSLHWFTLTYRDARTEREFVRHALQEFRGWFLRACTFILAVVTATMIFARFWLGDGATRWSSQYPNQYNDKLAVNLFIFGTSLMNMVIMQFRSTIDKLGFVVLELYVVANVLALYVALLLGSHYMGRIRGYPLPEGTHDTGVILFYCCVATGVNLNPYMRWHMMLPIQILCVLIYAVPALFLQGPHDVVSTLVYAISLAALVTASSTSKRMIQIRERRYFSKIIAERTSRAESAFQLSQARLSGSAGGSAVLGRKAADEVRSVPETQASLPTTCESEKVFNIKDDTLELEGLRQVGLKEQWLVDAELLSLRADNILGVGGFGIVAHGQYQGVKVAVKVPKAPPQGNRSLAHLMALCNELRILRRLRHPNIVVFYGAWLDQRNNDLALILEYVDGGSLRRFISSSPSNSDRAEVLPQISCALRYLHTRQPRVVHGDLKDTNIFVEARCGGATCWQSYVAKLLDFGLARCITKNSRPMGGSLLWIAPEIVQGRKPPDTASDVFSYGRAVFFVVTGSTPAEGKNRQGLLMDLKTGVLPPLIWPPNSEFASDYQHMVESCNQATASCRPGISEAHETVVQLLAKHSDPPPGPPYNEVTSDVQRELRALRSAARDFRSKAKGAGAGADVVGLRLASAFTSARRHLEGAPEEDVARAPTHADGMRLYRGFGLTPLATQTDMLAPTVVRCNINIDVSACCHFHAAVQNLRNLINMVGAGKCKSLAAQAVGQCVQCGTILTEEDMSHSARPEAMECDVCGGAAVGPDEQQRGAFLGL